MHTEAGDVVVLAAIAIETVRLALLSGAPGPLRPRRAAS